MPSTFTTRNRLEKQNPGENNNTWGALLDTMIDMVDLAMDGMVSFTGDKVLTTANGTTDEARRRYINITGGTTATVTVPNVEKFYVVRNAGSGAATITTGSGTTATVPAGTLAIVVCEGGNVCRNLSTIGVVATANGGTGTDVGTAWTASSPTPTSGTGTFTTVSCNLRTKQVGKFMYFYGTVVDTANGTAASDVRVSMPVACAAASPSATICAGMITGAGGTNPSAAAVGRLLQNSSTLILTKYDATFPLASGQELSFSGVYETV